MSSPHTRLTQGTSELSVNVIGRLVMASVLFAALGCDSRPEHIDKFVTEYVRSVHEGTEFCERYTAEEDLKVVAVGPFDPGINTVYWNLTDKDGVTVPAYFGQMHIRFYSSGVPVDSVAIRLFD